MKSLRAAMILGITIALLAAMSLSAMPASAAPVAYWDMNETSGTTIADSSGNGHDGTAARDASIVHTDGIIGGALMFNGTNDRVLVPASPAFKLDTYTYAAWVKPLSLPANGDNAFFFDSWAWGDAWMSIANNYYGQHGLSVGSWEGVPHIYEDAHSAITNTLPNVGQWYYVTAVRNSASHLMTLYVDGEFVQTVGMTYAQTDYDADPVITFGYRYGTGQYVNVVLDEVRVYDTMLSGSEIRGLYQAGAGSGVPEPATVVGMISAALIIGLRRMQKR